MENAKERICVVLTGGTICSVPGENGKNQSNAVAAKIKTRLEDYYKQSSSPFKSRVEFVHKFLKPDILSENMTANAWGDLINIFKNEILYSEYILGAIDYNNVLSKRNENWQMLHDALRDRNKLCLYSPVGPYMYPFYCENGVQVRKALAEKKIFIPTLWPNVLDFDGCELEKDYVRNILPLPVDQRYGIEDMEYMVQEVLKCIS